MAYTPTVAMFSSVPARMMRTAISARFAAMTLLKGGTSHASLTTLASSGFTSVTGATTALRAVSLRAAGLSAVVNAQTARQRWRAAMA